MRRSEIHASMKSIEEINEKRSAQKAMILETREKEKTEKHKPRMNREVQSTDKSNELRVIVKGSRDDTDI